MASVSAAESRRFTRLVYAVSVAPAAVAPAATLVSYVCFVKWKLHRSTHRAYTPNDMYYIRGMHGSSPSFAANPGIRIEPGFLITDEQEDLRFECKVLLSLYGYNVIPFWQRPNWNKQIAALLSPTRINAYKVTGRSEREMSAPMTEQAEQLKQEQEAALIKVKPYESNEPIQAPWNSAHKFDVNALPKLFQELVQKIETLPGYKLGLVRDVTIDYRDDQYFKVDPHVTPGLDGVTVFMLTLQSDEVMTIVPPKKEAFRRASADDVHQYSFTDQDLDVLHKRGDLLCLTDDAREKMDWCVRLGIDARVNGLKQLVRRKHITRDRDDEDENNQESEPLSQDDELYDCAVVGNEDIVENMKVKSDYAEYMLCDWWGNASNLIPRNKEKFLITISFARPT